MFGASSELASVMEFGFYLLGFQCESQRILITNGVIDLSETVSDCILNRFKFLGTKEMDGFDIGNVATVTQALPWQRK